MEALALAGRVGEAREIRQKMARHANHLGLCAEEMEPESGEFRGNFPQAFSHVRFINSALRLSRRSGPYGRGRPEAASPGGS